MTEPAAQELATWPVVQTDAGPVTLATVEALQGRAGEWRDWASKATALVRSLRDEAEDHLAAAGAALLAHTNDWMVPSDLEPTLERAKTLAGHVATDDQRTAALKEQESSSGFIGRIGVRHQEHEMERDRVQATAELRGLLVPIARSAPTGAIAEADDERKIAADLESRAAGFDGQIAAAEGWATACDQEVSRRQEAIKAMGFDSLYEAAVLQTSGAQPVDSPLVLKSGEHACLSVSATLARMQTRTHFVGGSSGFSFPIGHTGIRYRVGSFRGEPVRQESLTKVDAGTFVLTNQRIAYVGRTKAISVPLAKVMHVEIYNDCLSIAREGKENPDFYLMSDPRFAIFLLNWVLSKQTVVGA